MYGLSSRESWRSYYNLSLWFWIRIVFSWMLRTCSSFFPYRNLPTCLLPFYFYFPCRVWPRRGNSCVFHVCLCVVKSDEIEIKPMTIYYMLRSISVGLKAQDSLLCFLCIKGNVINGGFTSPILLVWFLLKLKQYLLIFPAISLPN